ncbi:MAG: methylmalonyl Co-A mutase-associated GTPase MeaB [Acidobacteriota bacterium]|nr:methylmalonyl Co-A mutase-associated GTPase MeaB [Acidobacteriota bacterium]
MKSADSRPADSKAAPRRRRLSVEEYAEGVLSGDRTALGRAITLVESHREDDWQLAQELLTRLLPKTGGAHRVGISGVPGVGKSTFIDSLGVRLLDKELRVAVLAVDPSSSLSGGSILGDKTRMERLASDPRAFIRPSPTSGSLGGVGRKTRETLLLCEAAGFDVVLVETVGVGQSETVVAEMVDCFLVLLLAGAGDELQGIKRGILELADILAVTKADGENRAPAERARAEFEGALHFMRPASEHWTPRVVTCSALEERGIDELWELVREHRQVLEKAGELEARRRRQQLRWMWSTVEEGLLQRLRHHPAVREQLDDLQSQVTAGQLTPTLAARRLLDLFSES